MHLVRAVPIITALVIGAVNSDKFIGLIKLNDVMTPDEQKKTGIQELSDTQKQELEKWMNDTFALKEEAPEKKEPTLEQNINGGEKIQLTDGTLYEIAPEDRSKTAFWLTPIALKVGKSNDPQYPTQLTNPLTGESVKAKIVNK
jgi:hypothetical protein